MSITFNMNVTGMTQSKDPSIKLFGRNIPFPDTQMPPHHESKVILDGAVKAEVDRRRGRYSGDLNHPVSKLCRAPTSSEADNDQTGKSSADQEKTLKKPDKIIPCPRCNSLETKFCYFNNYNVNQPRHFCKNCQRYWTAGGTMRNVPIGAGRRKNKHLPSQYRQILVSPDGVSVNKVDSSDSVPHQLLQPPDCSSSPSSSSSRMVLKFGQEVSQSKSLETVLALEEPSPCPTSLCRVNGSSEDTRKENASLCPSIDLHSVPRLLSWNPGWNNPATSNCSPENITHPPPVQVNSSNQSISLQFIHSPLWSCVPVWSPGEGGSSVNGCFIMGKRARDSVSPDEVAENRMFASKAHRIDDPNESVRVLFGLH